MKTISSKSSQKTLLCLTLLYAYQPTIQPSSPTAAASGGDTDRVQTPLVNIHQKVTASQRQAQAGIQKEEKKSLAEKFLDPASFPIRVSQILSIKQHLATALSFNQPTNIDAIMDSFISLEQMLSAAQTALKIYNLDNSLRSNINFLQKLQESIEILRHEPSINPNPLKEAFYSLSFIKKLINEEMLNKKIVLDKTASTTQSIGSDEYFKAAILALQKDSVVRAIKPDSINWNNVEIVFDLLTKEQQSSSASTSTHQYSPSSASSSSSSTSKAQPSKQEQGWVAWLMNKM